MGKHCLFDSTEIYSFKKNLLPYIDAISRTLCTCKTYAAGALTLASQISFWDTQLWFKCLEVIAVSARCPSGPSRKWPRGKMNVKPPLGCHRRDTVIGPASTLKGCYSELRAINKLQAGMVWEWWRDIERELNVQLRPIIPQVCMYIFYSLHQCW